MDLDSDIDMVPGQERRRKILSLWSARSVGRSVCRVWMDCCGEAGRQGRAGRERFSGEKEIRAERRGVGGGMVGEM